MIAVIEGVLFASGEDGVTVAELMQITDLPSQEVVNCLTKLSHEYDDQGRGFQIIQSAGRYTMATRAEHQLYIEKLVCTPTRTQLGRASLETLAIIAYEQPITRVEIEELRGVKSDRILQTLQRKGLIRELGRSETIGRPILYGTTPDFLGYFGINQLGDLPPVEQVFTFDDWERQRKVFTERSSVSKS